MSVNMSANIFVNMLFANKAQIANNLFGANVTLNMFAETHPTNYKMTPT